MKNSHDSHWPDTPVPTMKARISETPMRMSARRRRDIWCQRAAMSSAGPVGVARAASRSAMNRFTHSRTKKIAVNSRPRPILAHSTFHHTEA